ncbi:MAG: radical SAM protein, partial [Kiritimatiellia bacterium]|nr:radical SAM protein [Kiritimatiellia bacterium]
EPKERLIRTAWMEKTRVVRADAAEPRTRHRDLPAPCYDGLQLSRYPGITESPNPMHRLWTERRWLKLQLAHGCYWRRCAFCDTTLDYISRFDPADPETVANWMESMIRETGETGFHFVDEAAPPALLRGLAETLLARGLRVSWWANIRFERTFSRETADLLARSGCVAVTGGIECAESRLLNLMNKGVTPEQAARTARAFSSAGVLVHAYLMYGFPGQTLQETADGLELVRQLFRNQCLHSAYWHRFALTTHSGMAAKPGRFGIRPGPIPRASRFGRFAINEIPYRGGHRIDPEPLGASLHAAVYNYMHGVGLDADIRSWFARRMPAPRLAADAVARWLEAQLSQRPTGTPDCRAPKSGSGKPV